METQSKASSAPAALIETTTMVPALWTQEETAHYLGVSPKWLERDRWAGATVPYVKVGRGVRYRAADVVAWVEKGLVPAKRRTLSRAEEAA